MWRQILLIFEGLILGLMLFAAPACVEEEPYPVYSGDAGTPYRSYLTPYQYRYYGRDGGAQYAWRNHERWEHEHYRWDHHEHDYDQENSTQPLAIRVGWERHSSP